MKKKTAAGVAAAVAIASIATNLLMEPTELVHSAAWLEAHTKSIEVSRLDMENVLFEEDEEEKLSGRDAVRARIIDLPVIIKALFLLPLWLLGAVPVAVGTGIFSALAPIWSHVAGFLLQAGVLAGVFCLAYKLLFPNRKLKELFRPKNFKWILLGAVGVTGVNLLLGQLWTGWPVLRVVLMAAAGLGILCLLWYRICGKLKGPQPGIVHNRYIMEGV